ncbi:MAG: hypothetical protein AABZ33_10370 [Chloroflexota bacterium]
MTGRVGWYGSLALLVASVGACSAATGAQVPESAPPSVSQAPATADVALPAAHLTLGGSASAAGRLGSWTIDGAGSDSPWIPAPALGSVEADSGSILGVAFEDGAPIGSWQASYAAVADTAGIGPMPAGGREGDAPALGRVTLEALPIGTWVVSIRLFRADGRGDATFYWLLRVR